MPENLHTEVWSYAGLREGSSGAFVYTWYRGGEVDAYFSLKKRLSYVSIGGQIEVTLNDSDQVYTGGEHAPRTLSSRVDDEALVARWVAADVLAQAMRNDKALQRKSQKIDPLDQLLAPLTALSRTLTRPERRALAVRILSALSL